MKTLEITTIDGAIMLVLARTIVAELQVAVEALESKPPDASLAIARLAGVREMIEAARMYAPSADATISADSSSLYGVTQDLKRVVASAGRFCRAVEADPSIADRPEEVFHEVAYLHLSVVRLLKNRSLRQRCMFARFGEVAESESGTSPDCDRYDN